MGPRSTIHKHLCACLARRLALAATTTAAGTDARADDVGGWLSEWLWIDFKNQIKTHGFSRSGPFHQRAELQQSIYLSAGLGCSQAQDHPVGPATPRFNLTAVPSSSHFRHPHVWEQAIVTRRVKTVALQWVRLEQRFRQIALGNDCAFSASASSSFHQAEVGLGGLE